MTSTATWDDADVPVTLDPATPPWHGRVRNALEGTDWTTYLVVDLVRYAPATSRGFEDDRRRVEVYRYDGDPPAPETYGTPERSVRVERVTRPVFEGHP